MNALKEQQITQKSTLLFEGMVKQALAKTSEKFEGLLFNVPSMPGLPSYRVTAKSNSSKKKIRPCLEKIVVDLPFLELDVTKLASHKIIVVKFKRDKRNDAIHFLENYKDESITSADIEIISNAIADEVIAPVVPEPEAELKVNRKSWQRLLTHSCIYRGKTYSALNYPKSLLTKTKIKNGEPFIMSLYSKEDATLMVMFLEHIKCPEIHVGETGTTVYGTLEPGVDYDTRYNDECSKFFGKKDAVKPEEQPQPMQQLPQGSPATAIVMLFNSLSPADQELVMGSIVVKNKKISINKETIEGDVIKKLTAKFKSNGYVIMGAEQPAQSAFSVTKQGVQIKHTFDKIAPEEAFKL